MRSGQFAAFAAYASLLAASLLLLWFTGMRCSVSASQEACFASPMNKRSEFHRSRASAAGERRNGKESCFSFSAAHADGDVA